MKSISHPGSSASSSAATTQSQPTSSFCDAKTSTPLLSFPSYRALVKGGGGPIGVALDNLLRDEPIDLVTKDYARQYRNWLLRK